MDSRRRIENYLQQVVLADLTLGRFSVSFIHGVRVPSSMKRVFVSLLSEPDNPYELKSDIVFGALVRELEFWAVSAENPEFREQAVGTLAQMDVFAKLASFRGS